MSLLVLSRSDVEEIISRFTLTELQVLMARVFSTFSSSIHLSPTHYNPHRTSIPMPKHTTLFMPARLSDKPLSGTTIKVVSVPQTPGDTGGLPGSTLVMDEATGVAKAIVNSRNLTALRNAAGSLLSTNLVRLHNPASIVVFGAGKQIEAHLDLHIRFFPTIRSCTIVNRTYNSRVDSLERLMESRYPTVQFRFIAGTLEDNASTAQEKIKQALLSTTLVVCATSSTSPLFPSSWVRTGTHVILVGSFTPSMHEVDGHLIRRAIQGEDTGTRQILLVDSREACAVEAGELIAAGIDGSQMVEIGELVTVSETGELHLSEVFSSSESIASVVDRRGTIDLREERDEGVQGPITLFKSVGIGLQDVAITCAVVAKAEEMAIGTRIMGYDS